MAARLQGKVAVVTGGGSGIGAATVMRFAQEGATVVICGRRREPLDEVVAAVTAAGGKAEAVVADVSDEAGFTAALEAAAQRHGGLDILVNNAMAYTWGGIEDMSTADWHANFKTSVDGYFNPYGMGTANSRAVLDFIGQGYSRIDDRSRTASANVLFSGSLLTLPGGAVQLALGAQFRKEQFDTTSDVFSSTAAPVRTGCVFEI